MFHNPFIHGSWKDGFWGKPWHESELWNGKGYPIWQPYQDGLPIKTSDPHWNFSDEHDQPVTVKSPQEYKHTMSSIINGLIIRNFEILKMTEEKGGDHQSPPGTWDHYTSCAPPWIYLLSRKK